MNRSRIYLHK